MDYSIALSPDLDISPAEFAEAWNESEHAQEIAPVTLTSTKNESFFDQATMDIIMNVAIGVSSSIVAAAIYDALKKVLIKKGKPHTHIKYMQHKQPDGSELIFFDKEEM